MNPKDSLKFSILSWCTVISLFTDFIPVSGLNSTNSSQSAIVPLLRATSSPRQANSSEGPNFELELLDSIFSSQKSNVTKSTSYGSVLLPKGYNRLAIPLSSEGKPVYTYVSLFLRTVLEVDETNEALTLDADIRLQWVDWKIWEHLTKNEWMDPETNETFTNVTLDSEILKKIWKPDIFIDEMATADRTYLLSKLITLNFLGNTGNSNKGDIVYSARTTLKLRCDMDFKYYPADTQECRYFIRSYSYKEDVFNLSWAQREEQQQAIYLDDPTDPNFDLQISTAEPGNKFIKFFIEEKFDEYRSGKYSTLKFVLKARRKLSYHVVQTYLPSVLLILITWLCFLLPANMVEARIGISMTTLLTLTAMFSSVRGQSPAVSYTMAIDIWMVFCIFFVFIALLLFTLIYWMNLRLTRQMSKAEKEITRDDDVEIATVKQTYHKIVDFTKRYAFWTFAIIFLTFLIGYWCWILNCSGYFDWNPNPKYNSVGDVNDQADDGEDGSNLYIYTGITEAVNSTSDEDNENEEDIEISDRIRRLLYGISENISGSSEETVTSGMSGLQDERAETETITMNNSAVKNETESTTLTSSSK